MIVVIFRRDIFGKSCKKQKRQYLKRYCRKKQMTGIEPASKAWEAFILPMNYICKIYDLLYAEMKNM